MKNIWIHDDVRRLQETTPALQQEVISLYEWAKTCRVKRPLSPDDPALILDLRAYPHPVIQQELIWYALSQILCRDIYWENIVKYHLHYYPRFIAFLMKAFPNGLPTLRSLHDEDIARFAAQYPNDTRKKLATIFLRACRHDLCTFFDGRSPFDQDIWELNRFHLPAYRINRNSALKTFSFEGIPSEHNKVLVKRFVEYKLLHTELAKGTIYTHLQHLRAITRLLGATPLEQMTVGCVERLLPELSAQKAINEHLYTLRDFFETGITLGLWKDAPFSITPFLRMRSYQLRADRISDFVLQQIFEGLDALPHTSALLFLVLYYTGMRFTEASTLKIGCIHQSHGDYVLRFYQTKMRKECLNPIPQHLYTLLLEQQQQILKRSPEAVWLLPRPNGTPYHDYTLRKDMDALIDAREIKNADGTPFHFHAHMLRHTFAMRLIRNDVPLATVQRLLHHASPEMTLCYAQIDEETKKRRYLEFCQKIHPERKTLPPQEQAVDDEMRWMHHVIHQILPNGFCSLPTELGVCPHANACLFCSSFYTTKEFLPVLRYQREKIRMLKKMQTTIPPRMQQVDERLEELIHALEGEDAHDASSC